MRIKNISEMNLKSGDVSDLIGKPSKKLIVFSIVLVPLVFIGAIVGALHIKCPQTIAANIEITNSVSAIPIISETSGWLEYVCADDGDNIISGADLAVVRTNDTKYHIKSPINGTVNYSYPLFENQYIKHGSLICYIMPDKSGEVAGWAEVSENDISKLCIGNKCIVETYKYPSEEYGNLIGYVERISAFPIEDDRYIIKVRFPKGIVTTSDKVLNYKHKLRGTVSVIVQDYTIFDLLLQPINTFFNNKGDKY
ncbi:HlyD family efflux transporter periplasmic adaptor subunit [Prevotella sp. P3-122]|uniref:HlyD family efflux transporter periplasmic adaptor subunit n=1 Tax=Prevotella sp. P3-122 TaxID=2024223 RepID=UPI000B965E38|nr:HlyD family efflux transporter periplasmic adaptor subunit [Prevotella sp. P3-122]OYP60230.1 hypothetical protein CIL02_09425 [Prevotella sp. P3-122]